MHFALHGIKRLETDFMPQSMTVRHILLVNDLQKQNLIFKTAFWILEAQVRAGRSTTPSLQDTVKEILCMSYSEHQNTPAVPVGGSLQASGPVWTDEDNDGGTRRDGPEGLATRQLCDGKLSSHVWLKNTENEDKTIHLVELLQQLKISWKTVWCAAYSGSPRRTADKPFAEAAPPSISASTSFHLFSCCQYNL